MPDDTRIGPENGSLLIVGGSTPPSLFKRFVNLSGGPHAPIVIIPTASGQEAAPTPAQQGPLFRPFTDAGATNLQVLHTTDRAVADSEAFVKPLLEAHGVWIPGGRHTFLADAYLGTRTESAFHDLLARGGCIGGSSAGATIQGPTWYAEIRAAT